MKRLLIIPIALNLHLAGAQDDKITNAFDDLQRKGTVSEDDSIMRVTPTEEELQKLLAEAPEENYFCFTEDRSNDIRLKTAIPRHWLDRTKEQRSSFKGACAPGEFYTWQIGIFAPYVPLEELSISFSDLKNDKGHVIPASKATCFNTEGVDSLGKAFRKKLTVSKGSVQPLWVGIDMPVDAAGTYTGEATITTVGQKPYNIPFAITVQGEAVASHGDNEGWRKTRLRWLNSDIAHSDEPVKPYIPLKRKDHQIAYLGGVIELSADGLPAQMTTRYDQNNALSDKVRNRILEAPVKLIIETNNGIEQLKLESFSFTEENNGRIEWKSVSKNENFETTYLGKFEFDGSIAYDLQVSALKNTEVKDIRLEIPYTQNASTYMMGLGHTGGLRPESAIKWNWNVENHQDKVWVGGINSGLNLVFKDTNFKRPLVNIYYNLGRINMPESWGNDGKGGITINDTQQKGALLSAFSGERTMEQGKTLHFILNALITPVKPINLAQHAKDRFYHSNSDVSGHYIPQAKKAGANYINIHHKKDIYPFINYPYYDPALADLKSFIDKAKKQNIGTRVYYTTRELTVKIPEIWALRSLGPEVIHDGPGKDARTIIHKKGPNPWLVKNFESNFIPAWYNAFRSGKYKGEMDISVITTPDSRWNNYYLEGLDWMVKNLDIAGVYIDDSALDRETLKRAQRILGQGGKYRPIDIHSWNHMRPFAGYANSLGIYMELLPFVDKMWIGERFKDDNTPDFWLVEMSGIPFGLLSETLDAKIIFRGMVFGMLPRLPWSGNPEPMWKLWDKFGMENAKMVGYWVPETPVKTNNKDVLATTYINGDKAMVAIANWTNEPQQATISVDQKVLGFKPSKAYLPEIKNTKKGGKASDLTQKEGEVKLGEEITIPAEKGMILILEK